MNEKPKITLIRGAMYDRPSIIEGLTSPEASFCAAVGRPYNGSGPIITKIEEQRQCGLTGFYDTLVAYAGEAPVLEVARWSAVVEYEHDPNANLYQYPF